MTTTRQATLGSHASAVREGNERAILTALRRLGEASKADLARRVQLTQNTAGLIVKSLAERGLIEETRKRTGQRGQPATLLRLNPDGAYAIGVKIGRRTQQSVLIDLSGQVLKSRFRECVYPLPDDALALVLGDIQTLRDAIPAQSRHRLSGVGVATPYNLGSWQRELDLPSVVQVAWSTFDIGAQIGARLDVPVFVENDGTAAAVAEVFNGHGRTLHDFATVYIGAAIGGGLVLGGNYRSGASGNAADLGLMPVPPSTLDSVPTPQGAADILLSRASAGSLMRHLRARGVPIELTSQIEDAMNIHPTAVDEWAADCVDALMIPLFTISSLLDLEAIVIDGVLPRPLIKMIVERLEATMHAHAPEGGQPPALIAGSIGRDAAALGAATLPFYFNYSTDRAAPGAALSASRRDATFRPSV